MKNKSNAARYVVLSSLRTFVLGCFFSTALAIHSATAADPTSAPVVDEAIWGFYAQLIGTSAQADGGYMLRWSWRKPNEELLEEWVHPQSGNVTGIIVVTPGAQAGELRSAMGGKIWIGTRQPDGSVLYIGEGMFKSPYSISVDGSGVYEKHKVKLRGNELVSVEPATQLARFLPVGSTSTGTSTVASNPDRSSRSLFSKKSGTSPLPAAQTSSNAVGASNDPAQSVATWGPLADLPGTVWAAGNGIVVVNRFEWINNKTAIRYRTGIDGLPGTQIDFRPGRVPNTLLADVANGFGDKTKNIVFHFDSAGVLVSDWYRLSGFNERNELRFADGAFESRNAADQRSKPDFPPLHGNFRRLSEGNASPILAESAAKMAVINEKAKRDNEEKERQRKREQSEKWNRVLDGASTALMATAQVAADVHRETQAQRTTPSSALSNNSAAGSTPRASFTAKPRANTGEGCSEFTADNYRSKAVNAPGDDAHLYAACGQAFELYHMYENAIKQGNSEADCDRTYNAHVGAAQNAIHYYQTRKAK